VSHPLRKIADDLRVPHSMRSIEESLVLPGETNPFSLVHWSEDDPLRDVLLATFGGYPEPLETGRDYERFIRENIRPYHYWAQHEEPIPAYPLEKLTPSEVSALDLNWDRVPCDTTVGFYTGSADNFEDIVNYWNLAACGLNILFVDPAHARRLALLRDSHWEFIQHRQMAGPHNSDVISVWSRSQEAVSQAAFPGEFVPYYNAIVGTDILHGNIRPALHYLTERSVLASLSERRRNTSLSFQFPEKPFATEDEWRWSKQHFVVSVRTSVREADDANTFWTPYVPDLNQ